MAARAEFDRLGAFEAARSDLTALAYRMLGDLARAEDLVQEAWLRWQGLALEPESPRAYLITVITRLCLNELDSARVRREESRSDRLPEPVDLELGGMARIERAEQVSMAFLVVLQQLTPPERAALLLRDVFEFEHREIAALLGRSEPACRKLLERARKAVSGGRRMLETSPAEHQRLLQAFVEAASAGDTSSLVALLADDAVLITDGGESGRRVAGLRNLTKPLAGSARVAQFVANATSRGGSAFEPALHWLNGQPAVIFWDGERAAAALLLAIADGRIQRVFFHADQRRLDHVGARQRRA